MSGWVGWRPGCEADHCFHSLCLPLFLCLFLFCFLFVALSIPPSVSVLCPPSPPFRSSPWDQAHLCGVPPHAREGSDTPSKWVFQDIVSGEGENLVLWVVCALCCVLCVLWIVCIVCCVCVCVVLWWEIPPPLPTYWIGGRASSFTAHCAPSVAATRVSEPTSSLTPSLSSISLRLQKKCIIISRGPRYLRRRRNNEGEEEVVFS